MQRQGAWLFYWSQEETAADLYQRLSQVPVEAYRAKRERFARRQESFRFEVSGVGDAALSWLAWKACASLPILIVLKV